MFHRRHTCFLRKQGEPELILWDPQEDADGREQAQRRVTICQPAVSHLTNVTLASSFQTATVTDLALDQRASTLIDAFLELLAKLPELEMDVDSGDELSALERLDLHQESDHTFPVPAGNADQVVVGAAGKCFDASLSKNRVSDGVRRRLRRVSPLRAQPSHSEI